MRYVAFFAVPLAIVVIALALLWPHSETPPRGDLEIHPPPAGARGLLRVSLFGPEPLAGEAVEHRTSWVRGVDYQGMEDNDLRGFLDGSFKFGWNQPRQIHVRLGRRGESPRYGEHEIFRVLHRWGDLGLPPGTEVAGVELTIQLEKEPPMPVRILLYAVQRDWNPGRGGVRRDNVSPPVAGEVWWNHRAWPDEEWGLPGVGYASSEDPAADTVGQPLADAAVGPGDGAFTFRSPRLTAYAAGRVRAGEPLLFLLKLDDVSEDLPGTMLNLYTGNHGDVRNTSRRPMLTMTWRSTRAIATVEEAVFLEHGRRWTLGEMVYPGATHVAATFFSEPGYDPPRLEWRTAADPPGVWRSAAHPETLAAPGVTLRLTAAIDPVPLGAPFRSRLRDAWVRTAPPEEQEVRWFFASPLGDVHEVTADYRGDYWWEVTFTPHMLGPWRYWWTQDFLITPYTSSMGRFDVVAADRSAVQASLEGLADELRRRQGPLDEREREAYMIRLAQLERAAVRFETPATFRGPQGEAVRALINAVRAELDEPVPDSIPMIPNPPADH
ncbi:MAG: hypothetical protein GF355_13390 [Candidatus Eisenbacteria bacterium]|nr:hypothetical protein [Candidatus Eisenbacteria bacterium]